MSFQKTEVVKINNKNIFKRNAFINGEFLEAQNKSTFPVFNPFNGEEIASVANCGMEETRFAISKAHQCFKSWRLLTGIERGKILRNWYELIIKNADDLATILTMEQGKPLNEAKGEILYGASFVEWFSEEAKRVYGDTIPGHQQDKRIIVLKQPVGVVAAITPWNFPNAMITRKVAPALAAGCTVVIKPPHLTPLSALALAALAEEAGFPPGAMNIIPSDNAKEIGDELTANPLVKKLSFTGSTAVGKDLLKKCADTVKKVSMELGGNAPFIVFDDADIKSAVQGAIVSKYRNAGQTCVCSNRLYVQAGVYAEFTKQLVAEVRNLKMGDGMSAGVSVGPLINEKAIEFVQSLVEDAKQKGAEVLTGGKKFHEKPGCLIYEPTVLTGVNSEMKIVSEEIFGPVAPVIKFDTEEEVIALANDTPYGLASYFYGRDHARIWRVAEALDFGMVGINTGLISTAVAPFGGVKESGFGREGSKYGIEDYVEIKYLCWSI